MSQTTDAGFPISAVTSDGTYTITVGAVGTYNNLSGVNITPALNQDINAAPDGDQVIVLFEPGTYGEHTPILIGSNTSVIGDDSTLSHIGTNPTSDNGALIANKDDYSLGGKFYVNNTDGSSVTLSPARGATDWLASDPGTPVVDTNILVEGMTFLSTGGNTFANQTTNNFGTWIDDAENVAIENNTYIGGTDGNAFVNVVNGIVANNVAVGQTNAAYDDWNGPVNVTIEDNTSFMGKGPTTGWSVLINSSPTGDAANPGNAVNDGIVDNQFASAYEYSAATNTDALLSFGITYEENITQQGNVDSVMDSPDGQGFFAANVDGSVMEDNVVTDPETTAGNSNNVVANRTSSDTQPAEATNGNVIGNLVFGGWASGGSAAITDQGGGTNTANNAVLGESGAPANAISNINYTGSDATTGSIQGSGTTLSGSGVTPELGITAPATLFAATATAVAVGGLAINDVNAADSLSVTLTTTFGTLSLTGGAAHVTYGNYGGQNGVLLTGTPAQIDAALAGLTYTGNAAGYDDAIEVNVSDPSSLSATRYIPVTVGDFGAGQDQVITIPAGELIPMETVASEFPGQTLPAAPNLGGEIVIAAAGDNLITMGSTVSMAFLGLGANTVQGGNTQEYIATESGPSTINLDQGGDVTVAGGAGPLDVNAATGDNLLELGSSDANISLGSGANSIVGGLGNATIQGGSGTACIATLPQDGGAMNISLGSGNATIYGLSGNDVIQTQMNTSNVIYAGIGNDSIMSGGSDAIFTGAGAATVNASGAGATSVFGGTGSLYFIGGAGNQLVDVAANSTIIAGSGNLTIGGGAAKLVEIPFIAGAAGSVDLQSSAATLALTGFNLTPIAAESLGGNTLTVSLADGTRIQMLDAGAKVATFANGTIALDAKDPMADNTFTDLATIPGINADQGVNNAAIINAIIAATPAGETTNLFANSLINDGMITLDPTTLVVDGALTGTGVIKISANSVLVLDGSVAAGQTIDFTSSTGDVVFNDVGQFNGTIDGVTGQDGIDLPALAFSPAGTVGVVNSDTLQVVEDGQTLDMRLDLSLSGTNFDLYNDGDGGTLILDPPSVPCFLAGTMIKTPEGETRVEDLRIGDLVVDIEGTPHPVKWIGTRRYRAPLPDRVDVVPILISAGAFGRNVPDRDLYLSPLHALYMDGVLVPAGALVNEISVRRCPEIARIDYFHIETEAHQVILANNTPAETFIDMNSRTMFENHAEYVKLHGRSTRQRVMRAPRLESGPGLERIRRNIAARAGIAAVRPGERQVIGFLETVAQGKITGWAAAQDQPHIPVTVDILRGNAVLARTIANIPRPDVKAAGIGNGRCGFEVTLPAFLAGIPRHEIGLRCG